MVDLGQRVEEFLAAPVAAAFFVLADRYHLSADRLAEPDTAAALVSDAIRWLNPWSGTAAADRAEALRAAQRLRALVSDVLGDARNTWWSSPLDRGAQLLLLDQRALATVPAPDPVAVPVPTGASTRWENYAQRPAHQVMTTTELRCPAGLGGGPSVVRSGAHADLWHGVSDWDAVYPVRQSRLRVAAGARVREVHSAGDWHELVAEFGDAADAADAVGRAGSDRSLWESAGIDNGPGPVCSRLAQHADGVHVSLAGLLSGLYVPVSSPRVGATTMWAWYWESTWWVRSVFEAAEELEPLWEAPDDQARFQG